MILSFRTHLSHRLLALAVLLCICIPAGISATPPALTKQPVATGLDFPIFITAPRNDSTRVFVVELPGRIRLIKNGVLQTRPFLDITDLTCDIAENGLLGLAFDPNYATNGYFYVSYNDSADCNLQISRFKRYAFSADSADPASETSVMLIDQPEDPNHNGGSLLFGPNDGYLYIPTGDGTCCGDPFNSAQDSSSLRGKVLRIDVSSLPYSVPPNNPFVGPDGVEDEIWAFGLRNPYRSSFDRQTGDLYIADVGQDTWEEVNFVPSGTPGGINFGWPNMEATHCYRPPDDCDSAGMRLPITEYQHIDNHCSITGGYVYRGCAMPSLQGYYIFGDYCNGDIWIVRHNGTGLIDSIDVTPQIGVDGAELSGFGEDASGELYVAELLAGRVSKIVPDSVPVQSCPPTSCCVGIRGNVNGVGGITVTDLTFLVSFLFNGGSAPPCLDEANVNGLGGITITDLTYLVSYLFNGGTAPPACP